jgi:adenine-specific DNA-methyltransferase
MARLRAENAPLAADIEQEISALTERRPFGLNFERHVPEAVELAGRKVRRGDKVRVLPPRGEKRGTENDVIWTVAAVNRAAGTASIESADVPEVGEGEPLVGMTEVALDDLVVVAEFRDPIYPGLVSNGRVERGGDKPFHTVINAENYHALQMLLFTHLESVDVILIDPPYNTGKDSWVYNDRFVEANDDYRHSKWLAFVERRLVLATRLLKPSGLLFINIDDNEHARLKLLCDQVMGSENFVASCVWKSKSGGANDAGLAVDHEYVLVYRASSAGVILPDRSATSSTSYNYLDEHGAYGLDRLDKQNLSYSKSMDYDLVGPDGCIYVLEHKDPKQPNATWRWSKDRVAREMDQLVFKDGHVYTKNYEKEAYVARSLLVEERFGRTRTGGSDLKAALGPTKVFDYPKPVKLIEHLIGISAGPDAVVLDFFGGSGTTTAATMSLNAKDGGRRSSILVTNNEVSRKQAVTLQSKNLAPGDPEWEVEGVFQKVCVPRIKAVVGESASGNGGGFNENVEFLTLTYEAPLLIATNRVLGRIAPLLWMRAGARGRRIEHVDDGWDVADTYGVIADLDRSEEFRTAVAAAGEDLAVVFIITDEDRLFEAVARDLPEHVEPVRLYESYMRTFEAESGRGAL